MRSHTHALRVAKWSGAIFSFCIAVPVFATELETSQKPAMSPVESSIPFDGFGQSLNVAILENFRGGTDTVNNDIVNNNVDITGDVFGNTAQDVVTGNNIIDGGAFANLAGLSTVIQNSGANVLIQNGTVVNVQFLPPGP